MDDAWEVANGLDPLIDDADDDPDGDGLTNLQEQDYGTDPQQADPDGDGLEDDEEIAHGTDPFDADSDDDGLNDFAEAVTYGTDPRLSDTDGDGLPDGWEVANALDPRVGTGADGAAGDPDSDGLTNLQEFGFGTNPTDADTDGDGLDDDAELSMYGSDPLLSDTDSDGLPDGWEVTHSFNPLSDGGTNHALAARWTFDEGAGDMAMNRVSTNWPGALRNMAATNWIAGRNRGALEFDGTNNYVSVSQADKAVVTGAPFTVTAVIWQDAAGTGVYPTVVSDGMLILTNRWPGFALRYAQPQNQLLGIAGNTNVPAVLVAATNWNPANVGRWVDVALSHDGAQARLFVNGRVVSVSATNGFDAYPQAELRIGGGHVNPESSYWKGKLDDVRIFRSALGTNELAEVNDWIGDADGDGLSNGREYELDTDPRDAGSP